MRNTRTSVWFTTHRQDLLIGLLLVLVTSYGSCRGAERLDARLFVTDPGMLVSPPELWRGVFLRPHPTDAIWFGANTTDMFLTMAEPDYNQGMTLHHPLLALTVRVPVRSMLRIRPAMEPLTAVRALLAAAGAAWALTLFCALRLMGCRRFDAVVMSAVGLTSASAMFWLVVPDTSVFASVSILLAFIAVAAAELVQVRSTWFVAASALTLGFTRTNWGIGIVASAVRFPWKHAMQITANAFACVLLLWGVQKLIFPTAAFPVEDLADAFRNLRPTTLSVLDSIRSDLFHGMVVPPVAVSGLVDAPALTVEGPSVGPASILGVTALVFWLLLLLVGFGTIAVMKDRVPVRVFLVVTLFYQCALQVVRGGEPFRHSLEVTPVLVLMTGLVLLTRARRVALALAVLLAISGGINNARQFDSASRLSRGVMERQGSLTGR